MTGLMDRVFNRSRLNGYQTLVNTDHIEIKPTHAAVIKLPDSRVAIAYEGKLHIQGNSGWDTVGLDTPYLYQGSQEMKIVSSIGGEYLLLPNGSKYTNVPVGIAQAFKTDVSYQHSRGYASVMGSADIHWSVPKDDNLREALGKIANIPEMNIEKKLALALQNAVSTASNPKEIMDNLGAIADKIRQNVPVQIDDFGITPAASSVAPAGASPVVSSSSGPPQLTTNSLVGTHSCEPAMLADKGLEGARLITSAKGEAQQKIMSEIVKKGLDLMAQACGQPPSPAAP